MPKVTVQMNQPPTFEYDISQEKLDEMTRDELREEFTTEAVIDLAEGAPYYEEDDWMLSIAEDAE